MILTSNRGFGELSPPATILRRRHSRSGRSTMRRLRGSRRKVALSRRPGSRAASSCFHGNLVHASPPNMTPYPRKIVYLTVCAVSNHITKFNRLHWIAHRDFTTHRRGG